MENFCKNGKGELNMEYLDVYDENKQYIGKFERNYVHANALWHNTVHGWIYDEEGNIYFQIRKEENRLYTTASGHVMAGETICEAFGREIQEEIGILVDYEKAKPVNVYTFKMDKIKADGTVFKDRAFSNVYVYKFQEKIEDFHFDTNEVNGIVKLNAKKVYALLQKECDEITGYWIKSENGKNLGIQVTYTLEDFLVNKGETAIEKYGDVLQKVIELTE